VKNTNLESIIHHFIQPPIIEEPIPFGTGHINDTYKFSVGKNGLNTSFILQKINTTIFQNPLAIMENIEKVAFHLSAQNYPKRILKPLSTQTGSPCLKIESNAYWRVFPFFENTYTIDRVEEENQAFEAAKAFGEYLNYLKNLDLNSLKTTIPNFHNGMLRLKKFEKVLKSAPEDRINLSLFEIHFIIEHQGIFKKINELNLPLRVTHNDTKINNVLFDKTNGKAAAIIDLDTLMPGIVLSDFGDMVRTFTNSADEDEADLTKVRMRKIILEALTEGFLSEMKDLTTLEKDRLIDGAKWIILMQALRFLTDFLEGDIYYKTHYSNHNLVRAKNQIALFKDFPS
jgi:thiamine kinase-like enzyme